MPVTRVVRDAILNAELNGIAYTLPAGVFVGFSTTAPNLDGSGVTEPVGNGYARVQATGSPPFTINTGQDDPREATNTEAIVTPVSTGAWGTLTHVVIFDALSAGVMRAYGLLPTAQNVTAANQLLRYLAGELAISVSA